MKEFVCNEAAGFQVNTTKCELLYIYFSEFGQVFIGTRILRNVFEWRFPLFISSKLLCLRSITEILECLAENL